MDPATPANSGYLDVAGRRIAFLKREGIAPTLVFFPGYASDMQGTKAVALDKFASLRGHSMLRLDYSGTGSSDGKFSDGTLELWLEDAIAAVDQLTRGPLILIGSSMGAWIALHIALRRSERVQALVGIAPAPDFTQWGFTADEALGLAAEGPLTRSFWESGQRLLLLDDDIGIDCPVRLIHGEDDAEVPLAIPLRTLRALRSGDVQLMVLKGGGHRLSQPHEIAAILNTVANLLETSA